MTNKLTLMILRVIIILFSLEIIFVVVNYGKTGIEIVFVTTLLIISCAMFEKGLEEAEWKN